MKKYFFLVLFIFFVPVSAKAAADHLVITQVQITGGAGATNHDFIEIYNPTDVPVELLGLRIVKRTQIGSSDILVAAWGQSTVIQPKSFYLLSHQDYSNPDVVSDFVFNEPIASNNGIAIKQGSSTTLDSVAWGEAENVFIESSVFESNPSANNSLLRKFVDGEPVDTENNSSDFEVIASTPRNSSFVWPEPEPETTEEEPEVEEEVEEEPEEEEEIPTPTYSSAPVIVEFLPNPTGSDSGKEWIKIYSSEFADISGWKLDDEGSEGSAGTSAFIIPPLTYISANQYVVLTIPAGKFALNNTGGDTVRLRWPNNHLVNSVSYTTQAKDNDTYQRQSNNSFVWASSLIEEEEIEEEEPEDEEPEPEVTEEEPEQSYTDEIIINEFFPEPEKGVEEFIELKNESDKSVNLKGWVLSDLASRHTLEDIVIPAGSVMVIYKSDSGIALNNYGAETITLKNPLGEIVAEVEYENSPKNQSYNFLEGEYFLSDVITPGKENTILGGEPGITMLPRTGGDWRVNLGFGFVLWIVIWYIYINLPKRKR